MKAENEVYKRLKATAKKRGFKLKDIGKKAGINDRLVFSWRYKEPKAANLAKVAEALNVSTDYLLYGTTQKTPNQPATHSHEHELEWYDLGMGFYGKVPDDLVQIYKKIGEKYILEHPERFTLTEKKKKARLKTYEFSK